MAAACALLCCTAAFGANPAAAVSTNTPATVAPLRITPITYTERKLANGLQVIAVPSSTSPTVSVQVWYHVGSKDDPAGRSGFAHLFEHLMFKSTRHLKSEQFDRLTEDVGGSNNAFTSNDVTAYHEVVPSNHLAVLLWAEAERMSNLNVIEANFLSERAVVEEEFRERVLASPYGRLSNAIPKAAYQVHPYKRPSIGSIEDLQSATLADVLSFHNTYYRPDNATLVVAGDFDAKQLDAWVNTYFGRIPRSTAPLPRAAVEEPRWQASRTVSITGPKVPLPAVALVWQAPPVTSTDAPALQIAGALLSNGESSRLNQALVYRQRIASQASFEADLRTGPSLLTAVAIASNKQALPKIKQALLTEVQHLARQPVTAAELTKIKTQVFTSALLTRQTPEGLASVAADAAVLSGGIEKINTDLVALQNVTAADVQRVMQRYVLGAHLLTVNYTQEGAAP
jgi:zinc protease